MTTRRDFLRMAPLGAGAVLAACRTIVEVEGPQPPERVTVRAFAPTMTAQPGITPLGIPGDFGRDGFFYVPAGYSSAKPAPLLVMLHGGGGRNANEFDSPGWLQILDEFGAVMLAPDSRDPFGWDRVDTGDYGPDVRFLDAALSRVFQRCNIDPRRIALGGFSDGATEALGLGIMNGDFFRATAGFSPGYCFAGYTTGSPSVFISHGRFDTVLSFANTRDVVVPLVRALGVPVQFVEFEGGHSISSAIARQGLAAVLGAASPG